MKQVDNDILTAEEKAALEDELAQFLGDTETRYLINYHVTGTPSVNRETGAVTESGGSDFTSKGALKVRPSEDDYAEMKEVSASEIWLVQTSDITTAPTVDDYITLEGDTIVSNGGFASGTGWTPGIGWSIASGVATKAEGIAANLYQDCSAVSGLVYQVIYTITAYTAGTLTADLGGTNGTGRTATGTYVEDIQCGTSNSRITFEADNSFAGSIDNVFVILPRKYIRKIGKPMPGIHYRLMTGDRGN